MSLSKSDNFHFPHLHGIDSVIGRNQKGDTFWDNMTYYLANGIYPSYPTFVKSIRLPITEQDKLFAKYQEACRKDVDVGYK